MSKVEVGEGGPIKPPTPSTLRVTIFSRRLIGLNIEIYIEKYIYGI